MAENGTGQTLTNGVPSTFMTSTDGVSTVVIICTNGIAQIRIPGLHPDGEWATIDSSINSGFAQFRYGSRGIKEIIGQGSGADADVDFYVTAIDN